MGFRLWPIVAIVILMSACGGSGPSADIEFVMKNTYALGEAIEFRVRNNSDSNYDYSINSYCPNVKLSRPDGSSFYAGLEGRVFGNVECDALFAKTLEPGAEVVLMSWDQCVGKELVIPGTYTVSDLQSTNGLDTEAESTFVIAGGDRQNLSLLCPSNLRE